MCQAVGVPSALPPIEEEGGPDQLHAAKDWQARPIAVSPQQHPLSCEAADWAALRAAAAPGWLALPLPVQVRILSRLAPGDLLKLVAVNKQLGRLALSCVHELHVSIKPSAGTAGAHTTGKEPAAAARSAAFQPSCGALPQLVMVPAGAKAAAAASTTSTMVLLPWLAKHGYRLQRLVLSASSTADVDAVLSALLACAEGASRAPQGASRVPQGPVQRLLRSLTWPPASPGGTCYAASATTAATHPSASAAALLACFQPATGSQQPSTLRHASGGLALQYLELHMPYLAHSTVAKLASLSKQATCPKVVLVCKDAECPP